MQIDGDSLSIPQYWETWNPHTLKAIDMLCGGKQLSMGFDSNKPGESVSIQFRGCQAAITGKTDRHGGYALVTVNDRRGKTVFSSLVDCYSLVPSEGIRLLTFVLLYGCYRITVKVTGDRPKWSDKRKNNYGSDDCRVRIDALYVFKAPVH